MDKDEEKEVEEEEENEENEKKGDPALLRLRQKDLVII